MAIGDIPCPVHNVSKSIRAVEGQRVFFGEVIYEPGGSFGPVNQSVYQIFGVLEGQASVRVNEATVEVNPGQAALFRPGQRVFCRMTQKRKTRHNWCSMDPSMVDHISAALCEKTASVLALSRRLEQIMELGLSVPFDKHPRIDALTEHLGLAALNEYLYASEFQQSGAREHREALRLALEWIAQESIRELTLPGLAAVAGVSPGQLIKLFRRNLGVTPISYLWRERARRGEQMLRETGLAVSEVAYRCGFKTSFHFSRLIRKWFGVTPSEIRHRAWSGQNTLQAGPSA
jgi:AraC-like DNA-binding protein